MNSYYKEDEWMIIEEGFLPEMNKASESIFSIANGYMGQRANFEEHYSGDTDGTGLPGRFTLYMRHFDRTDN